MAESATIARPYARAAFEHASTNGSLATWSKLLATTSAAVAHPDLEALLTNPRATPEELANLLAELCGEQIDASGRNFLGLLAENRRLELLPEIAAMFEEQKAAVENVAEVSVTSAAELTDAQRERLAGALRIRLGREVRIHCDVDPALIGGALIRSGDLVIDGSLRAKLERLSHQLAS